MPVCWLRECCGITWISMCIEPCEVSALSSLGSMLLETCSLWCQCVRLCPLFVDKDNAKKQYAKATSRSWAWSYTEPNLSSGLACLSAGSSSTSCPGPRSIRKNGIPRSVNKLKTSPAATTKTLRFTRCRRRLRCSGRPRDRM